MMEAVTSPRLNDLPDLGERRLDQIGQGPFDAGIDFDHHAQAGAELRAVAGVVDRQADGHALHHLDPVPGGVLRRQDAELRAGGGPDAVDARRPHRLGEGVDADLGFLARHQVGDVGLLQVRLDPELLGRDHAEGGGAGTHEIALTDRVDAADDAVIGGQNLGTLEVELGLVELGPGLQEFRMLLRRHVGIARQCGDDAGEILAESRDLQLHHVEAIAGFVQASLGRHLALGQVRLAAELALGIGDVGLRQLQLFALLAEAGAKRVQLEADRVELGLGLGDGDLQRLVVDAEQRLASLHRLVLADGDGDYAAGDVGADRGLGRFHIGVVGRDDASAVEIQVERDPADQERAG